MKWNTNSIVADLSTITNKKVDKEKQAQGDYYTRELSVNTGRGDGITIQGFNLDELSDVDTPTQNIEYVEIRNYHSDSDGGLSKDASQATREIYFKIVDYFRRRKIQIVDNLKDHF